MYAATLRRPGGRMLVSGDQDVETDTFTCAHTQRVVEITRHSVPGVDYDFCRGCMKPIAKEAIGKGCDPFEKKLERHEARGRFLRDIGLG